MNLRVLEQVVPGAAVVDFARGNLEELGLPKFVLLEFASGLLEVLQRILFEIYSEQRRN